MVMRHIATHLKVLGLQQKDNLFNEHNVFNEQNRTMSGGM